jgi:hypothetical protein
VLIIIRARIARREVEREQSVQLVEATGRFEMREQVPQLKRIQRVDWIHHQSRLVRKPAIISLILPISLESARSLLL